MFNLPPPYYNNFRNKPFNSHWYNQTFYKKQTPSYNSNKNSFNNNSFSNLNCNKKEENVTLSSNCEKPLFNLFGLDIYFDDILLICILFFLYEQGIQDQYLFIALILLLLN